MKLELIDLGRVSVETRGADHGQMFERDQVTHECLDPIDGPGHGDWDMFTPTGLCTMP